MLKIASLIDEMWDYRIIDVSYNAQAYQKLNKSKNQMGPDRKDIGGFYESKVSKISPFGNIFKFPNLSPKSQFF